MDRIEHLDVFYHERKVGTLALYKKYLAAFAYEREWIEKGFAEKRRKSGRGRKP